MYQNNTLQNEIELCREEITNLSKRLDSIVRRNTVIKDIEKAIMDSDVGITPENNGEVIRLGIPQPTEERRKELVKQCNKIGEKTKIEVRNVRSEVKEKLKKAIKDGLSEDSEKDAEADLQKVHDKYIKKIEDLLSDKQKEIMTV